MQILASSKVGNDKYELASPTKNLADLDLKQIAQSAQSLFEVTQGFAYSGDEGSATAQVTNLSIIDDSNSTSYKDDLTQAIQTLVANNNLMTVDPTSTANALILIPRKIGTQVAPNGVNYTRTAPLPFIWENGLSFTFRAIATNTTGMTAQIPALAGLSGSIDILDEQGVALPASSIVTNKFYTVTTATISSVKKLLLRQPSLASISGRNLLVNPQGRVSQQATTITSTSVPANTDDTYILDVINQVSDGNDICDYSQETTTVPTGSPMSIKCDQETANKQWGLVWFLPADEAAKIVGGVASLQFKARKGGSNATLGKLRAAIISWSSTADSITSDVVGTWAGGGTNPTLATNWTYENTPSDLTLTTSFQTFKIENVAIDTASAKNVGVFIWLDDTNATVADLAYIADVQLEAGSVCTPFDCRPISLEHLVVRNHFETHEGNSISFIGFSGSFEGNSRGNVQIPFFPKRIIPTLSSSAATTFRVAQGTTNAQGSSIIDLSWQPQINCASLDINAGAIFTNGLASRITGFGATLTYVRADARL